MIEFTDLATFGFIAYGLTYQGVKYWRSERRIRLKREYLVKLTLGGDTQLPEAYTHVAVLVFDRRGCLARKFPEMIPVMQKNRLILQCNSPEGNLNFCVLFSTSTLNLSGIHCKEDMVRQFFEGKRLPIAETGIQKINHNTTLEIVFPECQTKEALEHASIISSSLSMLLPPELITDAMAKELTIDLKHCNEEWITGSVYYTESEPDNWLSIRREGDKAILQLRTNFSGMEREASAEIQGSDRTHTLKVKQQVIGIHSTLTVGRRLYVTAGIKNEIVSIKVSPDNDDIQWRIKSANANDGGCWYTVYPPVGVHQKGARELKIHLEAKPANLRSRSLVLTLEAGTYPFSSATDITLMQGVCFNHYIEYPMDDVCARHNGVIETPLDYMETDEVKTYTVRVDSNQAWKIIRDERIDWVEVSKPELLSGHFCGYFTVKVYSNAGNKVKQGFPAARHTVLSLINDTGIVRDILIYQGGYVRIRGQYWLDRNLAANGKPAQVAIPLGLEEGSTLNHGRYFQFGSKTDQWAEAFVSCKGDWYKGKAENPSRLEAIDPSPTGWRIPSHIEIEGFINRPAAPMELQREEDRTNICILSDDGVPVYLPLCGHLSHINGCRITIPHGHRYWTGTSQSPVYGYSLCVEPSRQMFIMHDMKKYGFPIRCILDGE